ncbi:MAG: hypothetical protein IIB78_03210 [Proteobacteria bacterium]|nr:hypothetical protein [Pseudomonadota bacterium]
MKEDNMSSYISLEAELEDWFETPFDELPEDLQKRVERGFRPTPWDNQTPDDRRRRACLWDGWENPAFERERRRLWDLGLLKDMHKVKEEIEKWETTPHLSISELESKERHIEELNNELQTIEENISDGFEREERLAAELIAAEIEAYAEHDRIAAEKRAEEQRLEAIEQEDNNSLPKMGGVARGVQYDRLEQQAIKLYREGQFKSKLQASKDLYQQIKIHVYNENFKIPAPKASTIYRWLLKLN